MSINPYNPTGAALGGSVGQASTPDAWAKFNATGQTDAPTVGISNPATPQLTNGGQGISPVGSPMVNRPPGADVTPTNMNGLAGPGSSNVGPAPIGSPLNMNMRPSPPQLGGPPRVGPGMGNGPRAFGDRIGNHS